MAERTIVFVVFPDCQSLDLTGPYEAFSIAHQVLAERGVPGGYRLVIASLDDGPVRTESGLRVGTDTTLRTLRSPVDTLVVVGGNGTRAASQDPATLHQVRRLAHRARRVTSVCTGSFVLAAAGLVDGRTVCTHWARAGQLADRFPNVTVDADSLHRRDGNVWTSAGVTAGIDLALALVEDDHGADVAQTVARWLVMFLRRPGGQSQFAAPVWHAAAATTGVRAAQDAVVLDPSGDHRVAAMAERAAMSERHFVRVFARDVGTSPARYVEAVRVDAAARELETTTDTVDVIATRCGFGTAETMRRAFLRTRGISPTDHRRRFALAPTHARPA